MGACSLSTPNLSWKQLFQNVGEQGDQFNQPISPTNRYYAFLSKADLDESTNKYDVLFEVAPAEWFENAILSGQSIRLLAPPGPSSLYHIRDADPAALLKALGLSTADDLAEGSWYLITMEKGTGAITGDFYNPDIDTASA